MCETNEPDNITLTDFNGVKVKMDASGIEIGYKTVPQLMRGCMLLAKAKKEGKETVKIEEHPRFKTCGAMIDVSRNGVMRVDKVFEFIDYMALYGLNMLMLYTEDTYEVEGCEMFGYQRGRYKKEELKAIDEYGKAMGVEIIPCVQTLAHLTHYTKWIEGMRLSDRPGILCANHPPVYEFIEKCIATLRECFSSDRIHIGMDEAFEIGRGKYLDRFGIRDRKEIITEHLIKVNEICKKYGYKPMMWSDMYFRYPGKVGDFHRESTVSPGIA
ncbi:MAG: family 20 glycosylhydrolase, partial [Clostridia bacterium]|nr:family 20 glycosylhydrolase [Clostridia bacterium]